MRVNFKNRNYIKFNIEEVLMLLFNAEKSKDEELFDKCNALYAFLFESQRKIKVNNQSFEFVMKIDSPLCMYITKKYLEYNKGEYLEYVKAEEVSNALLYAIVNKDDKYIKILTDLIYTRDYEYYDEFKKNYPRYVINYIEKYMFYNYSLNKLDYEDNKTYLVNEGEEGFYLEHIILSEQKNDFPLRSKKITKLDK